MRKIVQTSTCVAMDSQGNESSHTMALCDDGTLWLLSFNSFQCGCQWLRMPEVPQGAVKAERLA